MQSLCYFQSGQNNYVKKWAFDATETFPERFTPDIDFTDESVVQCDVPVVKILFCRYLFIYFFSKIFRESLFAFSSNNEYTAILQSS